MRVADGRFSAEVVGTEGEAAVIRVVGELDLGSVSELNACLLTVDGVDIIVDLAGVGFMDSTGLGSLIAAYRRSMKSGRSVVLRAPQAQIASVLQLTGVDQLLTVEAEPSAADLPRSSSEP